MQQLPVETVSPGPTYVLPIDADTRQATTAAVPVPALPCSIYPLVDRFAETMPSREPKSFSPKVYRGPSRRYYGTGRWFFMKRAAQAK